MTDVHALCGAYAVDALDDDERVLFEHHLADCDLCSAELDSFREATAGLSDSIATSPPAPLRASVLSAISTVRQEPAVAPPVRAQEARTQEAPRRRFKPLLAAAAAVVVVGLGVGVLATQPWQDDASQTQLTAAERVVHAEDARKITVAVGGADLTLYRSTSMNRAALVTDDLPAAPAGKVYELWLQKDGVMVPAGLMPGGEESVVLLRGGANDAAAAGITIEPEGGSPQPTSEPIALFPFDNAT